MDKDAANTAATAVYAYTMRMNAISMYRYLKLAVTCYCILNAPNLTKGVQYRNDKIPLIKQDREHKRVITRISTN